MNSFIDSLPMEDIQEYFDCTVWIIFQLFIHCRPYPWILGTQGDLHGLHAHTDKMQTKEVEFFIFVQHKFMLN